MQINPRNTQTAAEAYIIRREQIAQQIADLQLLLEVHERRQQQDHRNWGFAGDLAHIAKCLDEALGRAN